MQHNLRITPGRLPAAVLAVLVHAVFFAVLVYSLDWKTHTPEPVMVELWQPPPPSVASDQPIPRPTPRVEQMSKPESVPLNPDIALAEKKRKLAEQAVREAQLAEQKIVKQQLAKALEQKQAEQKKVEQTQLEQKQLEQKMLQQAQALEQKQREQKQVALRQLIAQQTQSELKNESARALIGQNKAASASKQAADKSKMQDEFIDKIKAKIHGKIILPDSLQGNPQARFSVSVLPTGEVLQVKLLRGSGQTAYDDAVERAILKASPLPMPPDASLMNQFRDLDLNFARNE